LGPSLLTNIRQVKNSSTNHSSIIKFYSELTQVLVIGGEGYFGFASFVDVVDTTDSNKQCASIQDLPLPAQSMAATFYQDKVFACGGEINDEPLDDCFFMDDNFIWQPLKSLPNPLSRAASSNVADIWWLTGGRTLEGDSSTHIFNGIDFLKGPILPVGMSDHCQLTLNNTHVFFTEGEYGDTFMYNWDTQEWIILESLPKPSYSFGACGLLNHPEFGPEILALQRDYSLQRDFSFVYNLADGQWRDGPEPPFSIDEPSYATIEDGLVVAAASNNPNLFPREVYKISSDYEWSKLEEELEVARDFSVGIPVSEEFLKCN